MICIKCGKEIPDESAFCLYCGKAQSTAKRTHRRGNGQGSVYRRADSGSWVAKITLGKRIDSDGNAQLVRHTKSGFRTKRDALDYIARYTGSADKSVPTINELWVQYQAGAYTKLGHDKQSAYRTAYKRMQSIELRKIDTLTLSDLQHIINTKVSTFYPAKDIRDLLSHFYQLAEIDGFVERNLSRHLVLPDKNETIPNPFAPEEQKALWEDYAAGNWWTGYILLMIYTSMMPAELMSCRKEQIDIEHHQIIGAGRKTKVRKQAAIVLADVICPVVSDLMEHSSNDKLICINKDNFYKRFHETIDRLELRSDLTPYSCRHTTATALVMADIQPSVIQKIMRHAKLSSTQRYIHVSDSAALDAVNKL